MHNSWAVRMQYRNGQLSVSNVRRGGGGMGGDGGGRSSELDDNTSGSGVSRPAGPATSTSGDGASAEAVRTTFELESRHIKGMISCPGQGQTNDLDIEWQVRGTLPVAGRTTIKGMTTLSQPVSWCEE